MKLKLAILLICIMAIGCKKVFREYSKGRMENLVWDQNDSITFHPQIADTTKAYEMAVGLRHVYGLTMKSIPVVVTVRSPGGVITRNRYNVDVKDDEGDYRGSCAGDICDVETVVTEDLKFSETGRYTFIINHSLVIPRVNGIMEVGLIID